MAQKLQKHSQSESVLTPSTINRLDGSFDTEINPLGNNNNFESCTVCVSLMRHHHEFGPKCLFWCIKVTPDGTAFCVVCCPDTLARKILFVLFTQKFRFFCLVSNTALMVHFSNCHYSLLYFDSLSPKEKRMKLQSSSDACCSSCLFGFGSCTGPS